MRKTDSFVQPISPIGGQYPGSWPGYIHLQPRTADTPPRPDLRHIGDDYNGPGGGNSDLGMDVKCLGDGVVEACIFWNGSSYGFGNHIFIRHELTEELYQAIKRDYGIDSRILYSHYAHLSKIAVNVGQEVNKGQLIAKLGNSGTVYAHVHVELRKATGLGYESYPSFKPVEWINQYYLPPYLAITKYLVPIQPPPPPLPPTLPPLPVPEPISPAPPIVIQPPIEVPPTPPTIPIPGGTEPIFVSQQPSLLQMILDIIKAILNWIKNI